MLSSTTGHVHNVVLIKATLRLSNSTLATQQEPIHRTDVFFPSGALRYPIDIAPAHVGTDIIVHGTAYAPFGLPHPSFDVRIAVGKSMSHLRIAGPRRWARTEHGFAPTDPEPIATMPLAHEYAFGGAGFEQNPIGLGYLPGDMDPTDVPLPCIEDAQSLLTAPHQVPCIAAFGAIAPDWQPRRAHAGSRGPATPLRAPRDLDPRFFSAAPSTLWSTRPLVGGEYVQLEGLSRTGTIQTAIARLPLRVLAHGEHVRPHLARILIETDADRLMLGIRCHEHAITRCSSPQACHSDRRFIASGRCSGRRRHFEFGRPFHWPRLHRPMKGPEQWAI